MNFDLGEKKKWHLGQTINSNWQIDVVQEYQLLRYIDYSEWSELEVLESLECLIKRKVK